VVSIFEYGAQYRQENRILRELLLEQGLSQRKIDTRLRKRLHKLKIEELACETLERVSRVLEGLIQEIDLPEESIKTLVEKNRSKMH
jgi:hypothetical protein